MIAIATIFFGMRLESGFWGNVLPALLVTMVVILGIMMTLAVSYLLSKTLLKGLPTTFTLELPPYRTPQIGRVIYTAVVDRIIFVLSRAVVVAIPAGAIIWLLANISAGDQTLLTQLATFLQPVASLLGLDGFILLAFILSLPANELLMPIMLMAYLAGGTMIDFESYVTIGNILTQHGWTWLTALNVILFCLFHWPCATTLLTMKKETGSWKWTALGFILPTVIGLLLCLLTTSTARLVMALL